MRHYHKLCNIHIHKATSKKENTHIYMFDSWYYFCVWNTHNTLDKNYPNKTDILLLGYQKSTLFKSFQSIAQKLKFDSYFKSVLWCFDIEYCYRFLILTVILEESILLKWRKKRKESMLTCEHRSSLLICDCTVMITWTVPSQTFVH